MSKILEVSHLSKTFYTKQGMTEAIGNLSFHLTHNEFLGVVGPSGCGKSTLLDLLTGLVEPTAGTISIAREKLHNADYPFGYMFQHDHLFDWRTIFDNLCLGLEVQDKLNDTNKAYINHLLSAYGLHDFKDHYPYQLSGGMRQRAALIRTLALQPEILLLDEPFSALDYQTRLQLSADVWQILKKEEKSVILITHDISEAISMCDRIIILSPRPAHIHKDIYIDFGEQRPSPIQVRELPLFQEYFKTIWKELNNDGL